MRVADQTMTEAWPENGACSWIAFEKRERQETGALCGNLVLVVLDTQVPTIEKSHSSPSTSKPSPSEGQARSHGTPRAHSKSGAARAHPDDAAATAEAAGQHRLQPSKRRK